VAGEFLFDRLDLPRLFPLGFVFGGHKCTGAGRVVDAEGFGALLVAIPPRQRACLRENVPLCLLIRSLPLASLAYFRLAWNTNLFLSTRVGQQLAVLVCFRKALPRRTSQSPLRHLRPSRFMNRNQSYIRLPPCKPSGRTLRTVPWVLQIPIPSAIPVPAQPTEK